VKIGVRIVWRVVRKMEGYSENAPVENVKRALLSKRIVRVR